MLFRSLKLFNELLKKYKYLIHFNGNGFDIPFIVEKYKKYGLKNELLNINSIDIFKDTICLKKIFKLPNHKQKTLEQFLGVVRDDEYSGGELINIYKDYLNNKNDENLRFLLLHNREDIEGLLRLSDLYPYVLFINGDFEITSCEINEYKDIDGEIYKEAVFLLQLNTFLPVRVSAGYNEYYLLACKDTCKVKVSIYTQELKYFYPNYKDYYYLPVEDTAIHKSVAFYVDKNFRTQAKAANCYSKKTGHFLPQYDEIIKPYFKINYNDKKTYFEMTDEFLSNNFDIKAFIMNIIKKICK